ncbi:MAG TPA: patatin-like phospholipase family protein [bacterium]|nr:patatin-like phospholipase family protein [bacterium]HPR86510.1 patatin-like phospholipase family protein [bacterium]
MLKHPRRPFRNSWTTSRAAGSGILRRLALVLLLCSTAPLRPQTLATIPLQRAAAFSPFSFVPEERALRPTVGLALSGGGLRGLAQLGVLQVLVEHNIPIDYIAGTSMGSVVGGLYASGYSPEELWSTIQGLDVAGLLNDAPSRASQFLSEKQKQNRAFLQLRMAGGKFFLPEAVTPGQKITNTLTDLLLNAPLHEADFSRLRVPLKIIATDLLSGQKVVLQHGNLIEAMRASIAVPLLLLPVEYDSTLLVDGGLRDNLPVDETRAMGADIVLAVDCTASLRDREDIKLPWKLVDQVTTIMQQEHNREQIEKADLVLSFKEFPASPSHLAGLRSLYEQARSRTQEIIPQLQRAIAAKARDLAPADPDTFRVQKILFESTLHLGFSELVDTRTSRPYTLADIHANLATLHETGYYQDVAARIAVIDQDTTLIYQLTPFPELNKIRLHGNSVFPDSLLLLPFAPQLGRPLNRHQARTALAELIQRYREAGYSLAEVKSIHFDATSGIADLWIDEGKIVRIQFEGAAVTRSWVLERDFSLKSGDLFQREKAQTAVTNLFGTGLFDAVTLMPQSSPAGWEIIVRLAEKKYTILRFGSHYDVERNGRAFVEVANDNIFGTANELTWHGQYGDRDQKTSLQLNTSRLLKSSLTSQMVIKEEYAKRFYYTHFSGAGEYERRTSGALFSLGMQLARLGQLSGFMRLEKTNLHTLAGMVPASGDLLVNTIGFTSIVDTRDQTLYPRHGKYFTFSYELSSGKFLGADISYFMVQNLLTTYWTWKQRSTFSPRLLWGTADLTTPFSEQYKIGGENSFYGLREEEWCGRNLILGSLEYRYALPWKNYLNFYLSTRIDFGAVWESSVDVKGSDFISGRGVALSAKTLAGPVSVAYGKASNGRTRWYFSAGYTF